MECDYEEDENSAVHEGVAPASRGDPARASDRAGDRCGVTRHASRRGPGVRPDPVQPLTRRAPHEGAGSRTRQAHRLPGPVHSGLRAGAERGRARAGWARRDLPARPGPRPCSGAARRRRLAQHRRPAAQPCRPPRPDRAARLLDLLLRQLPARDRGAAPARGAVRGRAGRRRRALAEVPARGRPRRARPPRSSATSCTTPSSTTPSCTPGSSTRSAPGRPWSWSTRRATSSPSPPARATPRRWTG